MNKSVSKKMGIDDYLEAMNTEVEPVPKNILIVNYDPDPVDLDPVQFRLPQSVSFGPVYIPKDIQITQDGEVTWIPDFEARSIPLSSRIPGKGQMRVPGILRDILDIEHGGVNAVVSFIQTWGCLGVEAMAHGLGTATRYYEGVASYQHWARRVRGLLNLAMALQEHKLGDEQDWKLCSFQEYEQNSLAVIARRLRMLNGRIFRTDAGIKLVMPTSDKHDLGLLPMQSPRRVPMAQAGINMEIAEAQEVDNRSMNMLQPLDIEKSKLLLEDIFSKWIAVTTTYEFRGSAGYASPQTRMLLTDGMHQQFWAKELTSASALLPIGMALLHRLHSEVMHCQFCGEPVPEPKPQVRKGNGQFCSQSCKDKSHRAVMKRNYKNKPVRGSVSKAEPFAVVSDPLKQEIQ